MERDAEKLRGGARGGAWAGPRDTVSTATTPPGSLLTLQTHQAASGNLTLDVYHYL